MRDDYRKTRSARGKDHKTNLRFLVFLTFVTAMFAVLFLGLYRLQIEQGEQHYDATTSQSIKSIAVKGSRGMITDINSVVLAKSEKAYNVTFYRENNDWDYPTKQLIEAIRIVESYGGSVSVTSPLIRNGETGAWEFNFGSGISETAWNTRKKYFYDNNYISSSKYGTPESAFKFLLHLHNPHCTLADGVFQCLSALPSALAVSRSIILAYCAKFFCICRTSPQSILFSSA